jgi:hypothetical protein
LTEEKISIVEKGLIMVYVSLMVMGAGKIHEAMGFQQWKHE